MLFLKENARNKYFALRKIFICLYVVLVLQRAWGVMEVITPHSLDALLFTGVALLGLSLIIYDLLLDRICLQTTNNTLLCLFVLSVFISSLLNINYGGISGNIHSILLLSIEFFLLYAMDYRRNKDEVLKEMMVIEHVLIIIHFIGVIISFVMFMIQFEGHYDVHNNWVRLGWVENRLFGVFKDPNYSAVTSILVILFIVKNFLKNKNLYVRIFYCINVLFQFIYIILSGSRTAEVTLSVGVLVFSYFTFRYILLNRFSKVKRFFSVVGLALAVLFAIGLLYLLLKKFIVYIPGLFHTNVGNSNFDIVSLKRPDVENKSDISNLRFKIWESAFELFLSKPIFGVSVKNVIPYAQAKFPFGFIAQRRCAIHSFYISTITCAGVVGAALLFGFIIVNILKIVKCLLHEEDKEQYFNILFAAIPLVLFLCSGTFLIEIIFANTIGVLIFWLYFGYTMYFISQGEEQPLPFSYKFLSGTFRKVKGIFSKQESTN